jgi:hypothetical protein
MCRHHMPDEITRPRIRADKEKVAKLFGVPVTSLCECKPSIRFGLSTIAIHCRHNHTADLSTGFALRDYTVIPEILMDEHGVFYGFAGPCICGKVFYIEPTIELLELAEEMAKTSRPQLTD